MIALRYNYERIKTLAKDTGVRITDLLALAPKNDPFYCGTPTDLAQGEWFADIWKRAGYSSGVHLRRVHYWTVSQAGATMHTGDPYENTERCWDYLVQASKMARYLGLVRIEDVADRKNPNPHVNAIYVNQPVGYEIYVPDLADPYIFIQGLSAIDAQPYHLEVWCEKSTMDDILGPVCTRYAANLVTFEGEVSITACHQLIKRIEESQGKPTRILYISDFDPAGNSMPVAMSRKMEYMLNYTGHAYDLKVKPLLLTAAQVKAFNLPRIPIKETERRATRFEAAFGGGAVELDALEALYPGTLGQLLRDELRQYFSPEAETQTAAQRRNLQSHVGAEMEKITSEYREEIARIREMYDRLLQLQIDVSEFEVERFEPHADDSTDSWLFDSQREYEDQLGFYKAHKGNNEKESSNE